MRGRLLLPLLAVVCLLGQAGAAAAAACALSGDFRGPPPPMPTPVDVALTVTEFRAIDEAAGSFTADFETVLEWRDPRLAEALAAEGGEEGCQLALDEVWRPELAFTNLVGVEEETAPYRVLERDGRLVEWRRYVATFAADFDIAAFPFDEQVLRIAMIAEAAGPDDIALRMETQAEPPPAAGWRVGALAVEAGPRRIGAGPAGPQAAALTASIPIARAWYPPFVSIYLPVLGCTLVALAVYLLPRDDAGNRIALSSTALLIAAAFSYLMADYVDPAVAFAPIHLFFWASILIPFVAFLAAMASAPLVARGRDGTVELLDRGLLGASALAFVLLSYLAWFRQ